MSNDLGMGEDRETVIHSTLLIGTDRVTGIAMEGGLSSEGKADKPGEGIGNG